MISSFQVARGARRQTRFDDQFRFSKIPAAPWPPPMHIVTMPYFALRRFISRRIVAVSFAPVQPERMPERDRAAVGIHLLRIEARLANHGQRLHGEGLVQLDHADVVQLQAARVSSAFGIATTGPMPMISGGTPADGEADEARLRLQTQLPRLLFGHHDAPRPRRRWSARSCPRSRCRSAWNAGFSFASASNDVSARGPSSFLNTKCLELIGFAVHPRW